MNVLDRLVERIAFRTDASGQEYYYPFGALGPAYPVENEAAKRDLRFRVKIGLLAIPPASFLSAVFPAHVYGVIYVCFLFIYACGTLRELRTHSGVRRPPSSDAAGLYLDKISFGTLLSGFAGSVAFAALGIWLYIESIPKSGLITVLCAAAFGVIGVGYLRMLILKRR